MPSSQARVRAATGADQEWLAVAAVSRPAVEVACELIARCSDGVEPADAVLDLPVGARTSVLWDVRRLTFGDAIDAVVECAACNEKLNLRIDVSDVLAGPPADREVPCTVEARDGCVVTFRLPTGADQLAAAADAEAARALCRRIVVGVSGFEADDRDALDGALANELVDALIDPIGAAVAAADPLADTTLAAACPACGAEVVAELDAYGYLRDELLAGAGALLAEVHLIASRYHWSEREILALPIDRRRAYLDLIAERST